MKPFVELTSVAASLPRDNIDTDAVIPARFLKTILRTGLGAALFADLRKAEPDFVLDRAPFTHAQVLVVGRNFGCGSSREHAPWALLEFGIRCVIAESFADIFSSNCVQNGILPLVVADEQNLKSIREAAEAETPLTVSLEEQTIRFGNHYVRFEIDPARRTALLEGRDAITQTLNYEAAIEAHEAERARRFPWLAHADSDSPRP